MKDILDAFNHHVKHTFRRIRLPQLHTSDLVQIAFSGTEDGSKLRWQFSVLLDQKSRPGAVFWQRIKAVFGIRAVVGHTGMTFLEDDRLMVELADVPSADIPFVVHNTQIANVTSIIQRGVIPGGGMTSVVHSQTVCLPLDGQAATGQQSCAHDGRHHILQRG